MATEVIYRQSTVSFDDGAIIALLPYEVHSFGFCKALKAGHITGVDYNAIMATSVPAPLDKIQPVADKLRSMGYKSLKPILLRDFSRFIDVTLYPAK